MPFCKFWPRSASLSLAERRRSRRHARTTKNSTSATKPEEIAIRAMSISNFFFDLIEFVKYVLVFDGTQEWTMMDSRKAA